MTDKNPHLNVPPMGQFVPRALADQRKPIVEEQPELFPEAANPKRSMGDIARGVRQTRLAQATERAEAAERAEQAKEAALQIALPYEDGMPAASTAHRTRLESRIDPAATRSK